MAKKTIVKPGAYVPTQVEMGEIDDNFTEVYTATADNTASIATILDGSAFTEYANNAAAVSGGLTVGDLYLTTGTVMAVTE